MKFINKTPTLAEITASFEKTLSQLDDFVFKRNVEIQQADEAKRALEQSIKEKYVEIDRAIRIQGNLQKIIE